MIEKDPVCLKDVETATAQFNLRYKVREFYFCSEKCVDAFAAHPEVFYQIESNSFNFTA